MKHLFTIFALAIVFSSAQSQIKLGLKGGLNVSTFSADFDTRPRIGFHLGAFGDYGFSDHASLQVELLYSMQGAKSDYEDFSTGLTGEETDILNYFNIPVLIRYHANSGFTAGAGLQLGFLVKAEAEIEIDDNFTGLTPEPIDLKEITKDTDVGIVLDLGYEIASGISMHGRAVIGLTDISDFDPPIGVADPLGTIRNIVYQVSLAVPLFAN